ncbi:AraC family transcriptional regulator [Sphingomonas sp. 35-24ZXX]|uniref:AraC family transcriptional regulator n=1 Tax=Sphingomonas sp. 35-24ZXX TaxID=1545915 RepID=UPI00053BDE2C|nr:AraC family transcriptional regulator [Sphingomonas sp. 35-24ZXX]
MDGQLYFFGLDAPLEITPSQGQVRAANLRGFAEIVRSMHGDPERIMHRFDLELRALADPDCHISCRQMVDMFEYCRAVLDAPLFGLQLAGAQDADVYGCVTALCRSAPDLRSALESFVDYLPIAHCPDAAMELHVEGALAELRWAVRTDLGINDQANLQGLVLNLKLLRMLIGDPFVIDSVELATMLRPRDVGEVQRSIGAPVSIVRSNNAIRFPAKLLDQPLTGANRLTYRLLGGYLGRLRITSRANTVEKARSYIRGALPQGTCSIERCAEKLGISVRTLQMRLEKHDTVYSHLVEAEREKLAKVYLTQTRMPLDEVAERLGYGEQTSFGRAFRRWTGLTPQKFRSLGDGG